MSRARRLGRWVRGASVSTVAVYAPLAAAVVFGSRPGRFVADDTVPHYWSPVRLLLSHAGLWDASRGLGGVRGDFWPATVAFAAAVRALHGTPAVTERLWHVALLTSAAVGAVAVARRFHPRIGFGHLVAGLAYMLNPAVAVLLTPSANFIGYALAPWFLVCAIGGLRSRSWRYPAIMALVLFGGEALNPPTLAFALLPIVPMAWYLVRVERSATFRSLAAWAAKSVVLALAVSLAALETIKAGAGSLAANLGGSESYRLVNSTSGWSESLRGLGYWLSYLGNGADLVKPELTPYFTDPWLIAATVAVPAVALASLMLVRSTVRWPFVAMIAIGTVVVAGSYPPAHGRPFGTLLLAVFGHVPATQGFRNTFKAVPTLELGVAGALGLLVTAAAAWRARSRIALRTVLVAAIAVAALPLTSGAAYPVSPAVRGIPSYWRDAFAWVDRQPVQGRVLILPSTTAAVYRWGSLGEDLFDALLGRPHVIDSVVPTSTAESQDLVAALSDDVNRGSYEPGMLAPIARRLGITQVLIRNDLDWSVLGVARPAVLTALRTDPDLHLVRTFGAPGENVTPPGDASLAALAEARLPPVEVYDIGDGVPAPPVAADAAPLLVSGSGASWPQLAASGLLATGGPVEYSADQSPASLTGLLDAGTRLVVTDTNRRQETVFGRFGRSVSETLGPGQDLDRPAGDLFGLAGSQTVAVLGAPPGAGQAGATPGVGQAGATPGAGQAGATLGAPPGTATVRASGSGTPLLGFQPAVGPAAAFDGDPATAWEVAGLEQPVGNWIEADLASPATVGSVQVTPAPATAGGRSIGAIAVVLDGHRVGGATMSGRTTVSFAPRPARSIRVEIDGVRGSGLNPVGIAEITVAGLDLQSRIVPATDPFVRAGRDPGLTGALTRASLSYLFTRLRGGASGDPEGSMHRLFPVAGTRPFALSGVMQLTPQSPDVLLDSLLGGPVGAYGSAHSGNLSNSGRFAVDGRFDTSWDAPAVLGQTLTLRFPEQVVDHVSLVALQDPAHSQITGVDVLANGTVHSFAVTPDASCVANPAPFPACPHVDALPIPPVTTAEVRLTVTGIRPTPAPGVGQDQPIGIAEVTVGNGPNPGIDLSATSGACVHNVVTVDGVDVPVAVDANAGEALFPLRVPFHACQPVTLDSGWHRLDGIPGVNLDRAVLSVDGPPPVPPPGPPSAAFITTGDGSEVRAIAVGPTGAPVMVTNGQSFDPEWSATVDGRTAGRPFPANTLNAWLIPAGPGHRVTFRYRPERTYRAALALTLIGLLVAGALAVMGRRDA